MLARVSRDLNPGKNENNRDEVIEYRYSVGAEMEQIHLQALLDPTDRRHSG
jgi:hypothetical protein